MGGRYFAFRDVLWRVVRIRLRMSCDLALILFESYAEGEVQYHEQIQQ